ncbi:MAG TPA: potassium transporter Kup [Gemmatimonadaceae bacterium]|nr:potassium transporter Kup [Gemmatimonadaceae bacterium]
MKTQPSAERAEDAPDARGPTSQPTSEIAVPPAQQLGHPEANPRGRRLAILTITALGVVYGDIGTSPLYALSESFLLSREHGLMPTEANVYGILSLILWSLTLIVTVKYVAFVMRADNKGEGGIVALLALLLRKATDKTTYRERALLIAVGLLGAALLYGDGVITPAISVLGAMEGLKIASPALGRIAVWPTVVVLLLLFVFQKKGTARVGGVFGPIMMVWFVTIAMLGVREIVAEPQILRAVNPWYALQFFMAHGQTGFILLGAVVLAVTGAEALYADMGHFGKRPIRVAWFALVFPALLLNYFGQGALLIRDPSTVSNPFYLLAPRPLLYPLIGLATLAAIIASQALISGAFSLTQQLVQLGYWPRVTIVHTSKHEHGQIYIPEVNSALMLGCLFVVIFFGSVSKIGAAYGIAVTGTMITTTLLFFVVATRVWNWPLGKALAVAGLFLVVDLAFFGANVIKFAQGGWFPLLVGTALYIVMTTWNRGRLLLRNVLTERSIPVEELLRSIEGSRIPRVPGTAIFMTSESEGVPVVLLHHLKHNKVLHERVILLSVLSREFPDVPQDKRLTIEPLSQGFFRAKAYYGFMQTPSADEIAALCTKAGVKAKYMDTTYYLGRERLIPVGPAKMAKWRKQLFAYMARNARSATEFFGIPPNRVVELGAQIEF